MTEAWQVAIETIERPEPTAEQRARWAAYSAKMERQRASRAKRVVAIREGGDGHCRWCARPIIGKRGKYQDKPDLTRSWCRDAGGLSPCLQQWNLHSRAEFQWRWLVDEYGERCNGCRVEKPERDVDFGSFTHSASDLQVDHSCRFGWSSSSFRRRIAGPTTARKTCSYFAADATRRKRSARRPSGRL